MEKLPTGKFYTFVELKETSEFVAEIADTIREEVRSVYGDFDGGILQGLKNVLEKHFEQLAEDNPNDVISAVQMAVFNYAESIGIGGLDFKIGAHRRRDQIFLLRSDEKDSPAVCIFQPYDGKELTEIEFTIKHNEVTMLDGVLNNDAKTIRRKNVPVALEPDSKVKWTCVIADKVKLDGSPYVHKYRRARKGHAPVFFNRVLK